MNLKPSVLAFIGKWLGVPDVGDNPVNRGQCVGLVEQWCDESGYPRIAGNAADLLANADKSRYALTMNGPLNFPPPGAIVCWDASWGDGFGHCAIVVAASSMLVVVFEQNNPEGSFPVVATHGYSGVAGWLVLR